MTPLSVPSGTCIITQVSQRISEWHMQCQRVEKALHPLLAVK